MPDTLVIQHKKLPCFQNLPLHTGDLNPENAHPLSSHSPESISHVSLFLQWLHVLEQLTSYVPIPQPKNEKNNKQNVVKKYYYSSNLHLITNKILYNHKLGRLTNNLHFTYFQNWNYSISYMQLVKTFKSCCSLTFLLDDSW